jgi:hypothetical protein
MKIDRTNVGVYDNLDPITELHKDEINKYIKNTTIPLDQVYRLVMSDLEAPYFRDINLVKLANPNAKVFIVGMTSKGTKKMLGINALSSVVAIDDKLFKRMTWNDVKVNGRLNGFKEQKNNKLIWYLQLLVLSPEVVQTVGALLGEKL